ncbi:hypothetical protein FIBSPDRAFT_962570 [Athelia psychrophila]|uniref:1-alkyl-2-acetylglycerophosphocholine esterase n=1 Tax=Athelia psychrophila TaxID=1759441 RepID=A0A166A0X1_9AGAM|nr:hypothetical protein FIBSPDRAFT_962570 [Fibularhizoctonia sp. CBS 109695]
MSALDEPQVPPIQNEQRSRFGTFLTRSLPEYTGPLPVGVRDIELPVPRQTFGSFQHAKMPGQGASLVMDSVLFSVFYPCVQGDSKHEKQIWFPKFEQTIDGLLGMAKRTPKWGYKILAYPLVAAAIYGTTLPARSNAPLRAPSPSFASPTSPSASKSSAAARTAEPDTSTRDSRSSAPESAHELEREPTKRELNEPEHAPAPAALDPVPDSDAPDAKWPLLIFSHGVGGSRQKYSHFCGEMASRGWVVVAIEHRDGTSPESVILLGDADGGAPAGREDTKRENGREGKAGKGKGEGGKGTTREGGRARLDWLDWGDCHWPHMDTQPTDDRTLRREQLRMRVAETYAVLRAMRGEDAADACDPHTDEGGQRRVRQGKGQGWGGARGARADVADADGKGEREEEREESGQGWGGLQGNVDARHPVLVGHSLGGSAAIMAAAEDGGKRFAASAIVALDPAAQRMVPWSAPIPAPLLVIGSEEFTHSEDFSCLRDVIPCAPERMVLSIVGTTHAAFTDASLILPAYINRRTGLKVDPAKFWAVCVDAAGEFLRGNGAFVAAQATRVGPRGEGGGEEGAGEGSGARKARAREGREGKGVGGSGLEQGTFVVHDL